MTSATEILAKIVAVDPKLKDRPDFETEIAQRIELAVEHAPSMAAEIEAARSRIESAINAQPEPHADFVRRVTTSFAKWGIDSKKVARVYFPNIPYGAPRFIAIHTELDPSTDPDLEGMNLFLLSMLSPELNVLVD